MNEKEVAIKHDSEKIPWHLVPWDAVEQIVEILQFGAKKYADRNWEKGMAPSRLVRAAIGHIVDWFHCKINGTDGRDPESGKSHLAHAGCCILFLLAYEGRGQIEQYDDRPVVGG